MGDVQRRDVQHDNNDSWSPEALGSLQSLVAFTGEQLHNADQLVRQMREDQVKELLQHGLRMAEQAIKATCEHIPASDAEQQAFARRIMGEVGEQHSRQERQLVYDADEASADHVVSGQESWVPISDLTDGDLVEGMNTLRTFLTDVRTCLLGLDEGDIDELAEAALLASRVVVNLARQSHKQLAASVGVQVPSAPPTPIPGAALGGRNGAAEGSADSAAGEKRVLWDPLGPKLMAKARELVTGGQQRPGTALAVMAAVLPFSWLLVLVAPPVLIGDAVLQRCYDTGAGRVVGRGVDDVVQVGRLWYLVGKVSAKQTWRFAKKEYRRVGGAGGIAAGAKNLTVQALSDPVGAAKAAAGYAQAGMGAMWGQVVWMKNIAGSLRDTEGPRADPA